VISVLASVLNKGCWKSKAIYKCSQTLNLTRSLQLITALRKLEAISSKMSLVFQSKIKIDYHKSWCLLQTSLLCQINVSIKQNEFKKWIYNILNYLKCCYNQKRSCPPK
jgi:hypothetical protein